MRRCRLLSNPSQSPGSDAPCSPPNFRIGRTGSRRRTSVHSPAYQFRHSHILTKGLLESSESVESLLASGRLACALRAHSVLAVVRVLLDGAIVVEEAVQAESEQTSSIGGLAAIIPGVPHLFVRELV